MNHLPMPSDVTRATRAQRAAAVAGGHAHGEARPETDAAAGNAHQAVIEPPSAKLMVRLFLIPLLIVAAAVGVMLLFSLMTGGTPSMQDSVALLKRPGGKRTAGVLVGPGSKQRYMAASAIADSMKQGMSESQRIALAADLTDILRNHTSDDEGDIRHILLLTLGRTWQKDPSQPLMNSAAAAESRAAALALLDDYADDEQIVYTEENARSALDPQHVATRKAAVLATAYFAGHDEAGQVISRLVQKLQGRLEIKVEKEDPQRPGNKITVTESLPEDHDVRHAAATALGLVATPDDAGVLAALREATHDTEPKNKELVWAASLSLAQLNQPDVADTILMLLDRGFLSSVEYYDRESDPENPAFRKLGEQEQQRILINTIIGASKLRVPAVQQRLRELAAGDPSQRVRFAAEEVLRNQQQQQRTQGK